MRGLVLPLLLVASLAQAQEPWPPPPASPYRLRLDVDLSLLLGGLVLWGATSFIGNGSTPPPWCGSSTTPPCDKSQVNAFDRWAIRRNDPTDRTAANVLAGVVPGVIVVLDVADIGAKNWRGWLTEAAVIAEAVLWTGAIQDLTRRAVRRPRPYVYTDGPGNRDGVEAQYSFFSGHTSNVFAMATAAAWGYTLRHPHGRWRWLVWTLAMAGATTEPVVRVLSGEHFPTDCIAGAAVGVSMGLLFPAIHRRPLPVTPAVVTTADATMLGVSGRF